MVVAVISMGIVLLVGAVMTVGRFRSYKPCVPCSKPCDNEVPVEDVVEHHLKCVNVVP